MDMISLLHNIAFIIPFLLDKTYTVLQAQTNPWEQLFEFLSPLLDPLFDLWENYALRVSILSTIIWSSLVICGLVFVVFEGPSIMSLLMGTSQKKTGGHTKPRREGMRSERKSDTSQRMTRRIEEKEQQKKQASTEETGVKVISKITKHYDKMILRVSITNGSDSKIDMVVVDLDLPPGVETDIGSFRMQRIGSIDSGQTETAEFALKSMGGDPTAISGQVEFLGASYEASKVSIAKPIMED